VTDIVRRGSTLYVAGRFASVDGRRRAGVAALDVASGALRPWSPSLPSVQSIALHPRSRAVLAATDNGVVAVDAASAKARWRIPMRFSGVNAMAVSGNRLYLAGSLSFRGAKERDLAAIDLRTHRVTGWSRGLPVNGGVDALLVSRDGRTIYVGGFFSDVAGQARMGAAAIDARGRLTAWDPNVRGPITSGFVESLERSSDGRTIYLGGRFESVGAAERNNLAAVDARTAALRTWDPRAAGDVEAMARAGNGAIHVGGDFRSMNAARRNGLLALTREGSLDPWAPELARFHPGLTANVRSLAVSTDRTRVYVGGRFTLGGEGRFMAVMDLRAKSLAPFGGPMDGGVWAIEPAHDGHTLYIGGAFTSIQGQPRERLAQVDAGTGALTGWSPRADAVVHSLDLTPHAVFAAGEFRSAGGSVRRGVAALDLASGNATAWDARANDDVYAVVASAKTVYIAGAFTSVGGQPRRYLAALDATAATASVWRPDPNYEIASLALTPDASRLYATGFGRIAGVERAIAEFDTSTGQLTAWAPAIPYGGSELALSPDGSTLVVGGRALLVFR
jgi:hypothetical protein